MDKIALIRSSIFISGLIIFTLSQYIMPSRKFSQGRWKFMASNLCLVGINNILIGILPIIPYQMAVIAQENQWGILNIIKGPGFLKLIIGVLAMDIVIYFQHRLFHQNNLLWRLHSMHHCDPMLDTTSGLRFHPIEIVLSNFIKIVFIFFFGISPLGVVVFEILLNTLAMFNHSNIRIHPKVEIVLSKVLITPALHTIHHSKIFNETNSNYGFSVPWWDKLFGSFKQTGTLPQEKIRIGIVPMPKESDTLLPGMLFQPFKQ